MAYLVEKCGEMVVSMDSQKSVPAPFLTKTYQLVEDSYTDHIVSWGEDETTFVVWKPPEFARDLLPNYFKHNNFSSFVRQLNTYGFRKIVADRWEFANEFFRKGQKTLLSEIHRRKSSQISQHYHQHHFYHDPILSQTHFLTNEIPWDAHTQNAQIQVPPPSLTTTGVGVGVGVGDHHFLSTLSEDNQRLRRRNTFLLSELSHMKKLYNDIIYFLQNHVNPVQPEQRSSSPAAEAAQLPFYGFNSSRPLVELSPTNDVRSTQRVGVPRLFGVPLDGNSKKRLHPEETED